MSNLSGPGTRRRRRLPIIPGLSVLLLTIAIGLFFYEIVRYSGGQDRIAAGVSVAGIDVGGLTVQEAVSRWEQAFAQPIVLYYDDSPILLDPASVGFRTNRETMGASAGAAGDVEVGYWVGFLNYLTGREADQALDIPLSADYQNNLLEDFLRDVARRYDRPSGTPGYDVQTLTTFAGSPGYQLDVERAVEMVDAALRNPDPSGRTVVLPIGGADASRPNINTLRSLIVDYLDAEGFPYDGGSTVASVFILDLQTGDEVNILGDVPFSAASTIKVAILIDYFRSLPFAPTQEEAWLMVNSLLCSNNSSSNLIMQIIGGNDILRGIQDVTNTARYLGARNSFIAAPFLLAPDQVPQSIAIPQDRQPNPNFNTSPDPFNQVTTEDLATLFTLIYDCANYGSGLMTAFPNGQFTQTECRRMLNLMSENNLERLLQGGIPPDAQIAHKNGWLENVHGDAGIVFPPNGRDYVIAVYVWENTDFLSFDRAWPLIEGISRAAWNYFSPDMALIDARTDLPPTAQECVNFIPPDVSSVNLDDMNAWRGSN